MLLSSEVNSKPNSLHLVNQILNRSQGMDQEVSTTMNQKEDGQV